MNLDIRPFDYSDSDYRQAVNVYNTVWTDHHDTVDLWRHFDEKRVPGYVLKRYVAEQGGKVVGVATAGQSPSSFEPGKFWTHFFVDPHSRCRGVGGTLFNHLLSELTLDEPKKLTTWTTEDQVEGIRFLCNRGFQQVMRFPESELNLKTFDPAPFAGKVARVQNSHLQVRTYAELRQGDPEHRTKLYETFWEIVRDVPSPDPFTPYSQEVWEERTFTNPYLLEDGWLVAVDNGQYVGLTQLYVNSGNPKILETGLTGVLRSHRRMGIATALKVLAIQYAIAQGYERIRTDNEENNPMYQINLALGFRPRPAGLDFVRHLEKH